MSQHGLLAVIPARGGSKGLPGKNIRPLAGIPLIGHSILMARMCECVNQLVVTTDAPAIADAARRLDAAVIDRPPSLAQDDTAMWPVVRHALQAAEQQNSRRFEYVLLLDPTSPGRLPQDIAEALRRLDERPDADGVIGVSRPEFNPIWHCVVAREGWMSDLFPDGGVYARRQDVPTVFRINASLYIWRAAFVRREPEAWRGRGRHLMHEIPESRAIHIDDVDEFERADALIRAGLIRLPWLERERGPV